MSESTIRTALGVLQDEPDNEQAWTDLGKEVRAATSGDPGILALLAAARSAHEMRREYEAVARLLELEVSIATGDLQIERYRELAHLRDDVLLDDANALAAYRNLLELRPDDAGAKEGIERSEVKRSKWKDLAQKYFSEAKTANDPGFKSSLLVSAAEIAYRYARPEVEARAKLEEAKAKEEAAKAKEEEEANGPKTKRGKGKKKKGDNAPPSVRDLPAAAAADDKSKKNPRRDLMEKIIGLLRDALTSDPKNRRAMILLERTLASEQRWEELAKALETFAEQSTAKDERLAALTRLARVQMKKLEGATERAITTYEKILDFSPTHPEATRVLIDKFTAAGQWDHLVALYEGQLQAVAGGRAQDPGTLLQVAMVNWKMRAKPEAAEPYFERFRRYEPAHPGMLAFFREHAAQTGDQTRLLGILSDAQRAMPDGGERSAIAGEIAQLAEVGENAQKAIEQWRNILRSEPDNVEAREALKRLYRSSGSYNHLADLLRGELERVAPDAPARLPILREIATIYRENIKSDSALVTVLSQIIALDATDAEAVRELARVYEALGRWRDLLTTQMRLAELEPDGGVKAELYRSIGRRWLEQFSNVQNAVEAFEKLRAARPDDSEALEKLRELYVKRRAYKPLYDLMEADAATKPAGPERRAIWAEMAKLASDRLDKGADATRLYRLILDEEPGDLSALDALEKQADRDKDYATVAMALEKRVDLAEDTAAKLSLLQKLAAVYGERLENPTDALRVWRRVLEVSPGHAKALRVLRESYLAANDFDALAELYSSTKDWEGLAEVLSNGADREQDPERKVALSYRIAAIFENEIRQPERAFRAYERVLSVKPNDERAATALMPIYEREEKWARLPALYEVLLDYATAEQDKRALYSRLMTVVGDRLADKVAAMRWARKMFELAPREPSSLQSLENLARVSGEWGILSEAIQDRINSDASAPDEKRTLRLKLAEVSAQHAGAPDDAVTAYRELIESNPNDEAAVGALDRLLRSQPDKKDDLRWLFKLRIDRAPGPGEAVVLLSEWAQLEEDVFSEPARAIAVYKELLERDPKNGPTLRSLARIYIQQGDAENAVVMYERERDLEEGAARLAREIDIARLYLLPLKNARASLDAAERALEIAPNDPRAIGLVEELLPLAETRRDAAVVLDRAYAAANQFDKQADILGILLATAASKADRLPLHLRLAAVKQNLNDRGGAFDVLAGAALEHPTELDLWDRLAALAVKTNRIQRFVDTLTTAVPESGETGLPAAIEMDLAERAATLYDENLGDIDKAKPYLERILAQDPTNDRAFLRLKQILTTRELWAELEALYERVIAAATIPERKTDLLAEVGIIAEEITGDTAKAVGYYERILAYTPDHDQATLALDTLYATQERWSDLAALLRKRIERSGATDPTPLRLRLATLLSVRLADPKGALDELEQVCEAEPANREARELVEKCLNEPDLRQRAATILETVYADRDEIRDLVRILEVRLEALTDRQELRELLQRIAELKDERLTDDAGAFATYSRLLPLAPGELALRERYLEIANRLARQEEAADILAETAKNADAPQPRAEILGEVAKIHEAGGRTEKSEAVHRQILELAPEDPAIALPAARALEKIYMAANRGGDLARTLRVQVKLESESDVRRELLGRLGTLSEETLSDDASAIGAWRERLDEDPTDEAALAALDRLYERSGDRRALVEILRKREENASDQTAKRAFIERAAKTYVALGEIEEAIQAYRSILDGFGDDRGTLGALAELYERAERWRDLEQTLETDLGIATEPADRIALLTRLGDVRRKRLGEVASAIESYREALTIDPDAGPARSALEELLDGNESARAEAAEILRPLYEASGANEKLLRVLDIQIEQASDLEARLELLGRAATVAEESDPKRAFAYAARGLREAAAESSVDDWLARVERLTERSGAYPELVELYRAVAPDVLDEDKQVGVLVRIAELARTKVSDNELAKASYSRALELRPDNEVALSALEELHEGAKEYEHLVDILKRKAEIAENDDAKRRVLYKLANVCDASLADRDRAIGAYEQILEIGLDAPAIEALERLYAGAARWNDLVALHERELGADTTPAPRRATINHGLGHLFLVRLKEPERGFDSYAEALRIDAQHPATIGALEAIMESRADLPSAARAAAILEPVYLARLDWRKVIGAVEARLEGAQDPPEKRELLRRLAKLHEEQEESYRVALDIMARLLAEDPSDETTWAELERLARVAGAEDRLAEIYAGELAKMAELDSTTVRIAYRTGELFEQGGDSERALRFYQRAYEFNREEEQKSFAAIDRILLAGERSADRIALYRDALDYKNEPADRLKTLHALATIQDDSGDPESAIETLRTALDVEERDPYTLDTLDALYTRREKWQELADLQRRRAEQSALPEDEAKWRLSLANVLDTRLGTVLLAIEELEAVTGLVAPYGSELGKTAVLRLEAMLSRADFRPKLVELLKPIYENADDWQKLVQIARFRFDIAGSPHEKVAVLRETAILLEERGSDMGRAFDCLAEAFVLDPDDGDTREELDRLAIATTRWDDLARTYEAGIEKLDGIGKKELLEALARLHDKRRDDPRKSLDAWERLFALDESDARPLDEMDSLATLLSDWVSLVRVLAKRAELTNDDEQRASLWRRIGEARRDMLDDLQGAIDAYERALELEPDSAWTLDNLIPLYEDRNDAARLVDLYRRRVEQCGEFDEDLKHRLLLDAATCYETGLQDRREAVVLLGQALAMKPEDPEITKRLVDLYEAEKMWPELLDALRAEVNRSLSPTADPAKVRSLTSRIGRLLSAELEDYPGALDAFREVLSIGYEEEAAAEVRRIGDTREELRRDAADILIPVLESSGKHDALADAYELRLRAETDPADRATTLRTIAKVTETHLKDLSRAQGALLRALAEQPLAQDLHSEIERIGAMLGKDGWERYANVLGERATSIFEPSTTADLYLRLGRIAEMKLGDLSRAAEAFAHSAEQGGDSRDVLMSLERVYAQLGDTRALVDILERRVGIETEASVQADLHHRLASLQIDALGDKAQGLATLRIALERVPAHGPAREAVERLLSDGALFDDAFDTLEGVYRSTNRGEDLARLYERRIDRADGPRGRTRARLDLARIRENEASDPVGAQRAVEAAIIGEPTDPDVLIELERLAEKNNGWREAASSLARALEVQDSIAPKAAGSAELYARLGAWQRDKVQDNEGAERAFAKALESEPESLDLVRALENLQRGPGRERDRVATLRRLAKLEGEPETQRSLSKEAATIAEMTLADAKLAEDIIRDLLESNDGDGWAMDELIRLRDTAGDNEEVVELLLKRAEGEGDGGAALAFRHRAAEIAEQRLNDRDRAVAFYEEILESERSDARAQERLRALYGALGKYNELAKLLLLLIDFADAPSGRAVLRIELAKLQLERFEAPRDASDTLRAILDEDPDHDEAAAMLLAIFDRGGRDVELAELHGQLVERARARGDVALELERMVDLGAVLELRVKDVKRALETYDEILARDPKHQGALEAVARLAESRGGWEKAAQALTTLLESNATVDLALRLANAKKELGDEAGVEDALKRALTIEPANTDVRERLAQLYERTKKWSELAALLASDADLVAQQYGDNGDSAPPAPKMSLAPGMSMPPAPPHISSQVRLLRRAADIHIKQRGVPADAIPMLERATKLVPLDRELLLVLCDVYASAKRDREAASVLERIIASFGSKRTKELSVYHHRLGRALAALGDQAAALGQYDMAFKIDPGSIEVLKDLGILAIESGDLERAQKTFRALLLQRLDANSPITKGEVFFHLGQISMKQGDKAKAVQMLERAIESDPQLARAKTMLGELKG